ncbi:MAG: metallophosphoesterase [Proteobacteria bacterium]|nr:metallophosphoesterase [Pseudomonadota bacterium]
MDVRRLFIIAGFALFFIVVQMVTLYGCYYSFRPFKYKKIRAAAVAYILFLNSSYLFLFYRYPLPPWLKTFINAILIYPCFIYMLVCLVLFPCFIISGIFIALIKLWMTVCPYTGAGRESEPKDKGPALENRRTFLKIMTSAVLLPVGGCSVYGTYIGRNKLRIEEKKLFFPDFPEEMDGLSLVQISDIHAGVFMEAWELQPFIESINTMKPDLVVITGDIISWGSYYIEPVVEVLGKIEAKLGIFAVMGNHDFYGNIDGLCAHLEKKYITVLRNRWQKIAADSGSSSIYLIGIDDLWATRYFKKKNISLEDILSGIPPGAFKILLSHNPTVFDAAAARGIPLTLSGHTHAGQAIMPFPYHHGYSFARLIPGLH